MSLFGWLVGLRFFSLNIFLHVLVQLYKFLYGMSNNCWSFRNLEESSISRTIMDKLAKNGFREIPSTKKGDNHNYFFVEKCTTT